MPQKNRWQIVLLALVAIGAVAVGGIYAWQGHYITGGVWGLIAAAWAFSAFTLWRRSQSD